MVTKNLFGPFPIGPEPSYNPSPTHFRSGLSLKGVAGNAAEGHSLALGVSLQLTASDAIAPPRADGRMESNPEYGRAIRFVERIRWLRMYLPEPQLPVRHGKLAGKVLRTTCSPSGAVRRPNPRQLLPSRLMAAPFRWAGFASELVRTAP